MNKNLLSMDTITVKRVVKHIPITYIEPVEIDAIPGSAGWLNQNLSLMFKEGIVWKEGQPYKVSILPPAPRRKYSLRIEY